MSNQDFDNQGDKPAKFSALVLGILALIADIITIALFINQLYTNQIESFSQGLPTVAIIVSTFTFAMLLVLYARSTYAIIEKITTFVGLYYVSVSSFFLGYTSQKLHNQNYDMPSELLVYVMLAALFAVFGGLISLVNIVSRKNLAIPFMLVGVFQVYIVTQQVIEKSLKFSWRFIGVLLMGTSINPSISPCSKMAISLDKQT